MTHNKPVVDGATAATRSVRWARRDNLPPRLRIR